MFCFLVTQKKKKKDAKKLVMIQNCLIKQASKWHANLDFINIL